jgi:16S rRNA processing protein RimM
MDENRAVLPERDRSERIAIGCVRKPFGLRGQFYADGFGKALGSLSIPSRVLCGKTEQGAKPFTICELKETPRGFIGRFEGIGTIEDAQQFRGTYLFLEKNELPDLGSNEYYHFELEGMTVIAMPAETAAGVVIEMQSFPTTDALVVRKTDGSTVLVALNSGFIQKIDRENGNIFVIESALEEIV